MGNVCSSGQKKKDGDNTSEKSEESPSYQLAEKNKDNTKQSNIQKGAPLADPEQISDLSTAGQNLLQAGNQSTTIHSPTNGNIGNKGSSNQHDSVTSTPQTLDAPCDIPQPAFVNNLPPNLITLQGKPVNSRRTERDRKIVLYLLSADNEHKKEKSILHSIYPSLQQRASYRGFEVLISNAHGNIETDSNYNNSTANGSNNSSNDNMDEEKKLAKILDIDKWTDRPHEAQGGHEEAANCLAEISRHSNFSYIIPVLFLGTSLGTPLLPLTIESSDFTSALNTADTTKKKSLLEKYYKLDSTAQPPCYRLNSTFAQSQLSDLDATNSELNDLLTALIEIFSKELRDSYLTTVVELEINNTVLISQELSKRCVWVQTGSQPPKLSDNPTLLEVEMNRRLISIHSDLKNQLSEKNLIRIPPTIQVQEDQLAAIMESLINTVIDAIVEEHAHKFSIPTCTFGVDKRLLSEIEMVSQYSKVLGQNCANFAIMDKVKSYLSGSTAAPLIIYGTEGCGKSVLAAKIMHTVHALLPECSLILRYVSLTDLSRHLVSLIGSIAEQISVITLNEPCRVNHTLEAYSEFIRTTLETVKHTLVIVIDSLDELIGTETISWLPTKLPSNIKIVITTAISAKSSNWLLDKLKQTDIPKENYIELTKFSDEQWRDVLSYGGGDFYASNGTLQLPEKWRTATDKTPLQAKVLWWLAWLGVCDIEDTTTSKIVEKIFDTLEIKFGKELTEFLIAMIVAGNGILETDLIQLLDESKIVKDSVASKAWFKFCWLMGPMLLHSNLIIMMDKKIRMAASQRYSNKVNEAHKLLFDFYTKQNLIFSDKKGKYKCYNEQKLLKLPYHAFMIELSNNQQQSIAATTNSFTNSIYLTDLQWIHDKLVATGCVQILSDIFLAESQLNKSGLKLDSQAHLIILKQFIETHVPELNYDGDQFYTLFNSYIQNSSKTNPIILKSNIINKWKEYLIGIKSTYLERLNQLTPSNEEQNGPNIDDKTIDDNDKKTRFDNIMNLNGKGYFVASISTSREEICVWDVSKCKRVRTLKGVPQPTSMCPVGDYGAAVLCKREIKVIDLDQGKFKVTLKGVMNQKMPYFGLHNSTHLVCLSRNRMYVNLMNLETGDCVTTFKAGEDRFLNSLLVSGDGRILVCGDETQKPFPLLVWHLSQRKLLYDLRIPHHDFITSLSAITHEGSYVCVVAKELNEPTPNFIVVYDLQSGTLFKKWKPSCNTVSLAISQTNACVIAGLEDARILIWDLVTGNCRCTLQGHNAPVTLLKLDPLGKILLSGDEEGRDMSIRLWELDTGKSLAVYTPPAKISTCEILPNGKYIILALQNHINLMTLTLRNYLENEEKDMENVIYGSADNDGKIFDLKNEN
ncbi:uncharacterized protein LOC129606063 [Condylostylus longicornis]|uniref:uncharacterized protein LOC129606063 n=1 Tax=Condylostylus longicornis TaxID=2530218 RepID=UPI00244E1955|nr:uncharacterized protein LOC129606063 [Condylostylus longicornis]